LTGSGATAGVKSLYIGASNTHNQVESTGIGFISSVLGTFGSVDAPPFEQIWCDMSKIIKMQGSNPLYGIKISGSPTQVIGSSPVEAIHTEDLTTNLTGGLILPTSIPTGSNLQAGAIWLNTTTNLIGTYDGSSWYYR